MVLSASRGHRPRNTYIYVYSCIVCFVLHYSNQFLRVLEARSKLTMFYTKFWVNRARFLASICTSLVPRSKSVQWNYLHFLEVSNRTARSTKVRLLVKTYLMDMILTLKVTMIQLKTKTLFLVFPQICYLCFIP